MEGVIGWVVSHGEAAACAFFLLGALATGRLYLGREMEALKREVQRCHEQPTEKA